MMFLVFMRKYGSIEKSYPKNTEILHNYVDTHYKKF